MNVFEGLGEGLRWLRAERGLKQQDLARKVGMTSTQLSRYERGQQTPNVSTLDRILDQLGADLRDLQEALRIVRKETVSAGEPSPGGPGPGRRLAGSRRLPEVVFRPPGGLEWDEQYQLAEVARSFGEFLHLVGDRIARERAEGPGPRD
ncbi:MAG TPA: helix-turn-helix transcriptional regulator [Thermoanaerobaculia bacterium]|nr:helix-turn-helix transcriptional regulator [Thermoanaerobaculia bacterium]